MRNLANLLVHLFGRTGDLDRDYLAVVHDQCLLCEEEISQSEAYLKWRVCPYCRFHYTLTARQRIDLVADTRSFRESFRFLSSISPMSFSPRSSRQNLLLSGQSRTGLTEATVTGRCKINGTEVMLIVLDFGFMGGSMGSVVGEKVALGLEAAAKHDLPAVALVSGGGARVQEGVLALMQMAKTVTAANRLRDKGKPFVVVLANPSTGQAYASFANLADVILAEPGALIGLSPLRTLREAFGKPLPSDAHTAEAHLSHGLLDGVVDREDLKETLSTLINVLSLLKRNAPEFKDIPEPSVPEATDPEAWEAVARSRHPGRPSSSVYIPEILDNFVELHGDRVSSDDRSILGGIGYLAGEPVAVIGQERRIVGGGDRYHTFPDGLRKAQRIIETAGRFGLPLVTLIDTQGADPGLEAEEQGIGYTIAQTLSLMADVPVPTVSVIIGEGGSEAALALGMSDRVLMQQNAICSPVSLNHTLGGPSPSRTLDREAAEAMVLTAADCVDLGIADSVVPEPPDGAHSSPQQAAEYLRYAVMREFAQITRMSTGRLLRERHRKFRRMGELSEFSQEAMNREVDVLLNIAQPTAQVDRGRRNRRKESALEVEEVEAEVIAPD